MTDEDRYSQDLYLYGYSGKWKEAKRLTLIEKPHLTGIDYWLAVRLCYLELGGYYKSQVDEEGRPRWNHHKA